MTSYEQGFLTKCAEYGVPRDVANMMLKAAWPWPEPEFSYEKLWPGEASARLHDILAEGKPQPPKKIVRAGDKTGKAIIRQNEKAYKKPETVEPAIWGAQQVDVSSPNFGKLTPTGTNIVNTTFLDKLPPAYHVPAVSNLAYRAASMDYPMPLK